jgi:hypothetical protein
MRQRWLSRRAVTLHAAVLLWVPGTLLAGWWQVTRALSGNGLSYLYSAEWPLFAVVGVLAWWSLVHTDPDAVGLRAQRRMLQGESPPPGSGEPAPSTPGASTPGAPSHPVRRRQDEDDALADYNDRLAALASGGPPKTWRRR